MRAIPLLLALSLATAVLAVTPTASADSCASTVAEHTVCTPVYAMYCAMYAGKYVATCEANVVKHCVEWCPTDLDGIIVLS